MTPIHIKNFFSIATTNIKLIEEVRRHFGRETSPRFNSFDFWWIDENKVSEILAFFLNPNENHEQGDIYLKHFIDKLKLNHFVCMEGDKIKVQCEYSTNERRRIDIVIFNHSQDWVIGIENKINRQTVDQPKQLEHYNTYLAQKAKDYCLIYLAPKDKEIWEESMSRIIQKELQVANKFKHLTYEDDLIGCISEFAMMTESMRVRSFLKDFEKTLSRRYMGERYLDGKKVIVDLVKGDIENLEVLFLARNALPEVKLYLKELFKYQMIELAKELNLEWKNDDEGVKLRPKNWNTHWIGYVFDVDDELYIMIPRSDSKDLHEQFLRMKDSLGKRFTDRCFDENENWWIYSYLGRYIGNDADFWLSLKRGNLKKVMFEILKYLNSEYNTTIF